MRRQGLLDDLLLGSERGRDPTELTLVHDGVEGGVPHIEPGLC